jgi:hypothetical protein
LPDARRRAAGKKGKAAVKGDKPLLLQRLAGVAGERQHGRQPFCQPHAREAFSSFSALIFIGATGIAVRVLAPLVNDKLSESC